MQTKHCSVSAVIRETLKKLNVAKKFSVILSCSLAIGCASRVLPPAQIVNVTLGGSMANSTIPGVATPVKPVPQQTQTPTKLIALNTNNENTGVSKTTPNPSTVNKIHNNASNGIQSHKNVSSSPKAKSTTVDSVVASDSSAPSGKWMMPTKGEITEQYTAAKKGIDISGVLGQPIYAASNGKVVYSGNGLKGYGNLIIIKHDNGYLTAYAHNKANLVKDGDVVKCGQKIATMGASDNGPILHLEVRKNGKPVDPSSVIGN